MKLLVTITIVAGFCVGTLGAAGFYSAEGSEANTQPLAWPLFGAGIILVVVGAALGRSSDLSSLTENTEEATAGREVHARRIEAVRDIVRQMDARKEEVTPDQMRDWIGELMKNEMFDLTSGSEELIELLGFSGYAKVWEGVASAERLLNRCWSMATDGHYEEGKDELPLALENLELASAAMASL